MIKRDTLKIQTPSDVWSVSLPKGASKVRILGLWDTDGNKITYDSEVVNNKTITVNLGLDVLDGVMDYEYEDGKGSIGAHESLSGLTLNITNTNTNTCGEHTHTPC